MSESNEQLAVQKKAPIMAGKHGLQLQTLDEMFRFAKYVSESGLAPKGIEREASILVAIQMGFEVGLTPMAALQNIAVVNGRPTLWGDAQLAVVRNSGELEEFKEEEMGKPFEDAYGYRVTVKRKGYPAASETFTVADAKRAGLWGKNGPWTQYPKRMLKYRARAFVLRDQFGDCLRGFRSVEEAVDMRDIVGDADTGQPEIKRPGLLEKRPPMQVAEPAPKTDDIPGAESPKAPPQNEAPQPPARRGRPPGAGKPQLPATPEPPKPPPPAKAPTLLENLTLLCRDEGISLADAIEGAVEVGIIPAVKHFAELNEAELQKLVQHFLGYAGDAKRIRGDIDAEEAAKLNETEN